MNKLVVWLIYLSFWWNKKHEKLSDDVLRRAARRYWFRVDWLIKFGLIATFAFFALLALLASGETCSLFACENRFRAFLKAPANEVGDTLAGIAGGLAFLWLVVTVLLQGKELSAQREELKLTRKELAGQRKATQDMALTARAQAEIFEDEKKYRDQLMVREELNELVLSVLKLTEQHGDVSWRIRRKAQVGFVEREMVLFQDYYNNVREDCDGPPTFEEALEVFPSMNNEIEQTCMYVRANPEQVIERPSHESFPISVLYKLQLACALLPRLSRADIEKIDCSELTAVASNLQIAADLQIWAEDF